MQAINLTIDQIISDALRDYPVDKSSNLVIAQKARLMGKEDFTYNIGWNALLVQSADKARKHFQELITRTEELLQGKDKDYWLDLFHDMKHKSSRYGVQMVSKPFLESKEPMDFLFKEQDIVLVADGIKYSRRIPSLLQLYLEGMGLEVGILDFFRQPRHGFRINCHHIHAGENSKCKYYLTLKL